MSSRPLNKSVDEFLKMLQRSAKRHVHGWNHYTTMTSLVQMRSSETAYLSLLSKSNDGSEYTSNRHYMLCFNYGREESVALWGIYGVPRKDSIMLTFPHSSIMSWLSVAKQGELRFWGVGARNKLIPIENRPSISICDVAYYGDNDIFTHNGKLYHVGTDPLAKGAVYKQSQLGPYVKKWAWSYEREMRIVVAFDKPVLDPQGKPFEHIAVDFDEPLQSLMDGTGKILLGPWCGRSVTTICSRGFSNANIETSAFKNLLRLRTPCDTCKRVKKTNANVSTK